MPVISCSRSTVTPRSSAAATRKMRSGVGTALRATRSSVSMPASGATSVPRLSRSGVSPGYPVSSDRRHFCSDSGNVRPIAMASPTDCIIVLSTGDAPGSFSNAQRGILVTT